MNAVNLVFTGLLLKNEVVSELMEAHLQLKKERGELLPARGFPLNNAIKSSNSLRIEPKEPSSASRKCLPESILFLSLCQES